MGIQINQLCNMNMKFAALFLFVGVTSATWCWEQSSNKCPKESQHGQATDSCCDQLGVGNRDRGCWVEGILWEQFRACCIGQWGCDGVQN